MNQLVAGLLEIGAVAHDDATLKTALADLAERFEFTGYDYAKLLPGDFYVISNLSPDWLKLSRKLDLERRHPIMKRAQQSRRAFIWSGAQENGTMPEEDQTFYETASQFGIRSGVTIPIAISNGGISVLSFVSPRTVLSAWDEIDPIAASSAVGQLHARIEQLKVTPSIQEPFYLSPKEATYTRWLSLGKTVEDTAEIEHVKYNTVRIALAEARRRYDLCNNTQLVALAIRRGLI
ncbi:autoinducer binding domain-containing protein [Rhizobium leguminosarum]|uniref:autoinducer binding domain-containing protein n=1 Tax=Rhizobium leguminosarum TaxID=384 RepID=UPI00143F57DA|nr:autoinducer binding domain-containing protein [Rhizobium leguminosarum]NKL24966.1 transcriptional regulator TraR [Rhizobium leguminosarum bv. viciae]